MRQEEDSDEAMVDQVVAEDLLEDVDSVQEEDLEDVEHLDAEDLVEEACSLGHNKDPLQTTEDAATTKEDTTLRTDKESNVTIAPMCQVEVKVVKLRHNEMVTTWNKAGHASRKEDMMQLPIKLDGPADELTNHLTRNPMTDTTLNTMLNKMLISMTGNI